MSKNNPTDEMILYLLGDLSEEEQTRIEEQFFTDDDAYLQLQAIEDELRYDYAQGGLSPRHRELFEKRFLKTPVDREQVELAKSVMEKALERAAQFAPAPAPKVSWWRSLFATPMATQFAGAVALLAVMIAASLVLQTTRLKNDVARLEQKDRTNQTEMAGINQQLQQERQRRQQIEKQSTQPQSPILNFLSFALVPGLVRGGDGPKRLRVPAHTDSVRLQLEIRPAQSSTNYHASLQNLDGTELWSQNVTGTGTEVSLTLPGRLLPRGDYMVELQAGTGANAQRSGEYYFTVVQ